MPVFRLMELKVFYNLPLVTADSSSATLQAYYQSISESYSTSCLVFQFQKSMSLAQADRRNLAIQLLQENSKSTRIVYSLPVIPQGLSKFSAAVLQSSLKSNVKIDGNY